MKVIFRIVGISLATLGTLIIAWRGKRIMDAIEDVNTFYEANFRAILNKLNNNPQEFPLTIGTNSLLEEIKPISKWLLALGFAMIVAGNVLVCLSWYLE